MRQLPMLSSQQKLAKKIRKSRIQKGFSQRQLAAEIGVTQPYLVQIEMGDRPISKKCLGKLEQLFQIKFGKLWQGVGQRGRPRHTPTTKQAMRQIGKSLQCFWHAGQPLVPKHPQPHQVRTLTDPLWTIALRLGEKAGQEVQKLESQRQTDESFWRQFNSLRFDSWSEKRLLVRVALLGAQLTGIRLSQTPCQLRTIDGVTGKPASNHRGFALKGQDASLLWCPQVTVQTPKGYRCVDNLLVISNGTKSATLAVELDGAPFHDDPLKERRRDRELGIPVLHVDTNRLDEPDLIVRILSWAKQMLEAA